MIRRFFEIDNEKPLMNFNFICECHEHRAPERELKKKIKTASCGCVVTKVKARHRRQEWKCEWETQGKLCESPAEVWVRVQDDSIRERQVYCHSHLMAHTVICGHPTEHVIDEATTLSVATPTSDVPEWLTKLRAMGVDEIIEFQQKLGELD